MILVSFPELTWSWMFQRDSSPYTFCVANAGIGAGLESMSVDEIKLQGHVNPRVCLNGSFASIGELLNPCCCWGLH